MAPYQHLLVQVLEERERVDKKVSEEIAEQKKAEVVAKKSVQAQQKAEERAI